MFEATNEGKDSINGSTSWAEEREATECDSSKKKFGGTNQKKYSERRAKR